MKRILFLLSSLFLQQQSFSAEYTVDDSLKVVRMLLEGAKQPSTENMVLFYAKQFADVLYGAATLEKSATEELVVNLHRLDCTTFVETVLALAYTTCNGSDGWDDFLFWLQTLRYQNGIRNGYASRNHYFSQWIQNNELLELVHESGGPTFSGVQKLDLSYMSMNPEKYPRLKEEPELVASIRKSEEIYKGKIVRYIPTDSLNVMHNLQREISDGDILAFVTNKKGLDVSHLGFAVWDNEGKLHLLHASSLRKKVTFETITLYSYLKKMPSCLGLRVIRPLCKENKNIK